MDLSTNRNGKKVCTIKFKCSGGKKSGFRMPELKVVDFPGGGWLEWNPSTLGSCHMSGDKDGGGEEATDPISLLNFKPMNKVHTEQD